MGSKDFAEYRRQRSAPGAPAAIDLAGEEGVTER